MRKILLNRTAVILTFFLTSGLIIGLNQASVLADTPADFRDIRNQQTTTSAPTVTEQQVRKELSKNPIVKDLNTIVNFLSAGVGLIVVIVIIVGGIQYSMAGDNAQAVSAARQRIINGLIALLAFLFMFAFLQWLVPGGVFNK